MSHDESKMFEPVT